MDICHRLRTLGWNADNPTVICCLALSWCLLSEDRFYFCTDGLLLCWVRNAPLPRLARALYLIFSPGCSLAGLPGQSCLLPARGRRERGEGGTFVNKTVTWTGSQGWAALPGQANPGVTGDTQPRA